MCIYEKKGNACSFSVSSLITTDVLPLLSPYPVGIIGMLIVMVVVNVLTCEITKCVKITNGKSKYITLRFQDCSVRTIQMQYSDGPTSSEHIYVIYDNIVLRI